MSKSKRYLVMDIGCLECGEDSKIVGVFAEKWDAGLAQENYTDDESRWGRPEWHGQHSVEIHDIKTRKRLQDN